MSSCKCFSSSTHYFSWSNKKVKPKRTNAINPLPKFDWNQNLFAHITYHRNPKYLFITANSLTFPQTTLLLGQYFSFLGQFLLLGTLNGNAFLYNLRSRIVIRIFQPPIDRKIRILQSGPEKHFITYLLRFTLSFLHEKFRFKNCDSQSQHLL